MTPPKPSAWEAAIAAVPHADDCNIAWGTRGGQNFKTHCTCDRDARIAKGIEAALRAVVDVRLEGFTYFASTAAALRAFEEVTP